MDDLRGLHQVDEQDRHLPHRTWLIVARPHEAPCEIRGQVPGEVFLPFAGACQRFVVDPSAAARAEGSVRVVDRGADAADTRKRGAASCTAAYCVVVGPTALCTDC